MSGNGDGCWHCGEALPRDPPLAHVAGEAHPVCCPGCRAAAEWIAALGLADYYRLREHAAARPPDVDETARAAQAFSRPELARHLVHDRPDGSAETLVVVEGLRCAACSWLIEHGVGALPGVGQVAVNGSARRARITFDPARVALPAIVDAFARLGYRALPLDAAALDDARGREARTAMKRLAVAGFGAMQAMMYASALYFGALDDLDPVARELFRWLGFAVATPVVVYAGVPFFAGAWRLLRARRLGMDVPVALAIILIYAGSVVEVLRGTGEVYFESVSMFVFFLLIGRYLEMRARHRAGDLTDALARSVPQVALRLAADGSTTRVGAFELAPGDRVLVSAGMLVPADGVLESAACRVDESLLTGESTPVGKRTGDALCAGSSVVDAAAVVRVERTGADTVISSIVALAARAASERPRIAQAGERAAARFVARVLTLAALTALGWLVIDPSHAFTATVAVLVVSCPCAFALAAPAAVTRALSVLAARGVLVVRPDALEALAGATHVMFDKTGTLTEPWLEVDRVETGAGIARDEALALAAALARTSTHPVARAIATALPATTLAVLDATSEAGAGITGRVGERELRLGHAGFALRDPAARDATTYGDDAVVLADARGVVAVLHVRERIREGARAAVTSLRSAGLEVMLVSGDTTTKVAALAGALGIEAWRARVDPAGKLAWLDALRGEGARVVAVGDGINDAPILAGADVGVAMASGAAIAQTASDIVLARDDPRALASTHALAKRTLATLLVNQRWALVYNLTAVPLAALGFVPPWLAALGMSASSLVVVLNALRLGREPPIAPPVVPVPAQATP
ncbi:MAG: cadmium-translocating P-type ATPase [Burkholderiales bacterium]|nr:cadmium-translocating P-type ATPase [Burkholderiales bacterium]